jgi:hypothetical protein
VGKLLGGKSETAARMMVLERWLVILTGHGMEPTAFSKSTVLKKKRKAGL